MFLIHRLILAHFLTDFPFQTDSIYKFKIRRWLGLILHGAIFAACSLILCAPLWDKVFWPVICLSIFHVIIDWIKIALLPRLKVGHTINFLLDQAAHVGVILLLIPLGVAGQIQVLWGKWLSGGWEWFNLLENEQNMAVITGFVVTVFAGVILARCLDSDFYPERPDILKTPFRRFYGMAERALLLFTVLWSTLWIIPVIFIPRIFWWIAKGRKKGGEGILIQVEDIILNLGLTILAFYVIRWLTPS